MIARLACLLPLALVGCGSSGAAKLGAPPGPIVLRLGAHAGDLSGYPAVAQFAKAVERRSGGRVVVRVVPSVGNEADDAEAQVVRAVAAGKLDLGFAHTGVFDTLGVTSLQALTAPLLISSRALEARVVGGPLATQMLAGVRGAGVTGLTLLAGDLRRPFGTRPLLGPDDYRGLRFAVYRSRTESAAIAALGARVTNQWGRALNSGAVDGFERTLDIYAHAVLEGIAPYITTNVALWPQTLALFADPRLSPRIRGWLRAAAADARAWSLVPRGEAAALATACAAGARVAEASAADVAALKAGFAPIYRELDPALVARIRALRAPADAPLAVPPGCTDPVPARADALGVVSPIDGTYRWTITRADKRHDPMSQPGAPPGGGDTFTIKLDRGRWTATVVFGDGTATERDHGTYSVVGDEFTQTLETAGRETNLWRFRRTATGLRMSPMEGDLGDAFVNTTKPWRRIGS